MGIIADHCAFACYRAWVCCGCVVAVVLRRLRHRRAAGIVFTLIAIIASMVVYSSYSGSVTSAGKCNTTTPTPPPSPLLFS